MNRTKPLRSAAQSHQRPRSFHNGQSWLPFSNSDHKVNHLTSLATRASGARFLGRSAVLRHLAFTFPVNHTKPARGQ